MNEEATRRYRHRRLADVEHLSVREIAERTGASKSTVQRDLDQTIGPKGYTASGTPYYPPGRFDSDSDYLDRVKQLSRSMPPGNAKLIAAREFAANPDAPPPKREPSPALQVERMLKAARELAR